MVSHYKIQKKYNCSNDDFCCSAHWLSRRWEFGPRSRTEPTLTHATSQRNSGSLPLLTISAESESTDSRTRNPSPSLLNFSDIRRTWRASRFCRVCQFFFFFFFGEKILSKTFCAQKCCSVMHLLFAEMHLILTWLQ
jgi:hypothetical protein